MVLFFYSALSVRYQCYVLLKYKTLKKVLLTALEKFDTGRKQRLR